MEEKSVFVIVPSDPATAALPCPICQERFHSEWDEELEEWVWHNAIQTGSKIYHQTCYNDLKQSSQKAFEPSGGILGKRKAEESSS